MVSRRACAALGDSGDIILGWMVRLVAVLAVVGVLSFDALSIGSGRVSIQDQASTAARAAADRWAVSHNAQSAFDSAWSSATADNSANEIDPKSFSIDPSGDVQLTVTREVPTFVVRLIAPLRAWAHVQAVGVAKPIPG